MLGVPENVANQSTYDPGKGRRANSSNQCLAGRIVVRLSDFSRERGNPDFFNATDKERQDTKGSKSLKVTSCIVTKLKLYYLIL